MQEGVVYLSSTGGIYTASKLDAEKLKNFSKNAYGAGVAGKHRNLIFSEKYYIEVLNPKGEPDPELAQHLTKMCDSAGVNLWAKMRLAWTDVFWYGMSLFNPVWDYTLVPNPHGTGKVTEYRLLKLRHLPAESFATAPYGRMNIYSEILKGVTISPETGEVEYYQTLENAIDRMPGSGAFTSAAMLQKKLTHVFTVIDPASGELAGTPIIEPIIPFMMMLDFTWQAQMQKVNRIGAPILFLEITDASGDDIEYGQKFLANWGKQSGMQIRTNMKLIIPDLKDSSTAIDTINVLCKMVVDYFSPASLISKDGTLIGGSSSSEQELMLSYIRSTHTWIIESFEQLLQTHLEANLYTGYTAKLYIPSPSVDKAEIWIKQAITLGRLVDAGVTVAHPNEFRDLLEMKELSPEEIEGLVVDREKYRLAKNDSFGQSEIPALMKARLAKDIVDSDLDPADLLTRKQYRRTVQLALNLQEDEAGDATTE